MRKSMLAMAAFLLLGGTMWGKPWRHFDWSAMVANNIATMQDRVTECSDDMQAKAEEGAAKVDELLAAGKDARAQVVMDRYMNQITRRSDQTIRVIERLGEQLANLLVQFGEPELAVEVAAAYDDAAAQIQQATDDALSTLQGIDGTALPE
jgi:hypothetical protein